MYTSCERRSQSLDERLSLGALFAQLARFVLVMCVSHEYGHRSCRTRLVGIHGCR